MDPGDVDLGSMERVRMPYGHFLAPEKYNLAALPEPPTVWLRFRLWWARRVSAGVKG